MWQRCAEGKAVFPAKKFPHLQQVYAQGEIGRVPGIADVAVGADCRQRRGNAAWQVRWNGRVDGGQGGSTGYLREILGFYMLECAKFHDQ